jgi:hypothetical protein
MPTKVKLMLPIGQRVFFPSQWNSGILDSVLHDSQNNVIAYIIRLDDGKKVAIDIQIVEALDD